MKVFAKNLGKLLAVLLFTVLGMGNAKAQSHNKAAANCVYNEQFIKDKTKKVAAVDGYCKICGNKKEEERKKKLAAEKATADQKNKQKQIPAKGVAGQNKAKDNEAILVAPTAKVTENAASVKRSAQDQEIVALGKEKHIKMISIRDYDGNGYGWFDTEKVYTTETINRIYYTENKKNIVLKDLKFKDYGYSYKVNNRLDENGNFCIEYTGYVPGKGGIDNRWSDIITIEGESLLGDKTIEKITYKGNGIYELQKAKQKTPTEQYDFKTKKITPIQ